MSRESAEQVICVICQKVFKSSHALRTHRSIHGGEKKHRCDRCGMRFHQKVNLKHHLNVHSNVKPYRCDLCAKGYNQPSNLRVHREKCVRNRPADQFDVIKVATIRTPAMVAAQEDNRIPFVGVFFANGSAKLYRAINRGDGCMLRLINWEDLRRTRRRFGDGTDITINTVASVRQQANSHFVLIDGDEWSEFVANE